MHFLVDGVLVAVGLAEAAIEVGHVVANVAERSSKAERTRS